MISFEQFEIADGVPIYLQIIQYLKRGMVSGAIGDGDSLPSRRNLSALLGVNPNTIQKAYHLLEEEGLIQSQTGAKSVVCLNGAALTRIRRELLEGEIRNVVDGLKQAGLTKQEALALMDRYWE